MDVQKPTQAEIAVLLAQVAEQEKQVRRLEAEVERLTKMIKEVRAGRKLFCLE
jgi:uncharacterized coiled-coil protein SlyX